MNDALDTVRILIVDDNRIYREAFRRNLMLNGYEVTEAENSSEALNALAAEKPQALITDLQMGTETEGLDLIRQVRSADPLLPIIMISAVGTFEEGALAQKYGADNVLSKSRIEEEIHRLYDAIETGRASYTSNHKILDELLAQKEAEAEMDDAARARWQDMLAKPDLHPYLRSEIYDFLNQRVVITEETPSAPVPAITADPQSLTPEALADLEAELEKVLPVYGSLCQQSRESLRIAEFLYHRQEAERGPIDFSRNIGFSYTFAVESEVKARLAKRLHKFLAHDMTSALALEMMENNNQNLSVYFHQHLLLLLRNHQMDFTMDNVKQTIRRILEHQSRYKPDGLKALGIMIICFARTYQWQKQKRTIKVHNPLGLRGFESEEEILRFAELLVSLQHLRNPYIHPEISEMEKLSIIREATFECLNLAGRIQP